MGKYTTEKKDAKKVITKRSIKITRKKKRAQEPVGC